MSLKSKKQEIINLEALLTMYLLVIEISKDYQDYFKYQKFLHELGFHSGLCKAAVIIRFEDGEYVPSYWVWDHIKEGNSYFGPRPKDADSMEKTVKALKLRVRYIKKELHYS
jgi:hypothetical protein